MNPNWPDDHSFAFTICDETDMGTLENLRPVYEALYEAGLRTTKTVWCLPCTAAARVQGQTLSDQAYCDWVCELAEKGFEIGWHGARSGGATRSEIESALNLFHQVLGYWPKTYVNHSDNRENIHWGPERFENPVLRSLYRRFFMKHDAFLGSTPASTYFWGDLCRRRIEYVRGFTFNDVVTTTADRQMPYVDSRRPYVRAWFSASDGGVRKQFCDLLSSSNLDRLERSGGACIVATHFACGFVNRGQLHEQVRRIFTDLAHRNGWYVPVSELLEYLEQGGLHSITGFERSRLEWRWSLEHLGSFLAGFWLRRRTAGARKRAQSGDAGTR